MKQRNWKWLNVIAAADVSVVICTYDEARFEQLRAAVISVIRQLPPPREVIIVVDHNEQLLQRVSEEFRNLVTVANDGPKGASAARNVGIGRAIGDVLAFIDDDAIAGPGWLRGLSLHLSSTGVLGVGGRIDPIWPDGTSPSWFPPEFLWIVGASYFGMPDSASVVRNVWTGNMGVWRTFAIECGGFNEAYGKVGEAPKPEDTEFCLRAQSRFPDGVWVYEPLATVRHRVPIDRTTFAFYLGRCFQEGKGKRRLVSITGTYPAIGRETSYALKVVLPGIVLGFATALTRRDKKRAIHALAMLVGLMAIATGLLKESVGILQAGFMRTVRSRH